MSDTPKHNPTPSGQAPKPKGILKNPLDRRPSQNAQDSSAEAPLSIDTSDLRATSGHNQPTNGLSWDEQNIALHDFEKESTQRMKIDEPKTPFVRGEGGDDEGFDAFNLDQTPSSSSFGGPNSAEGSAPSSSLDGARAAAELAANTSANAALGGARRPSNAGASAQPSSAVGLDAADLALAGMSSSGGTAQTSLHVPETGAAADNEGQLESSSSAARRNSNRSQSRSPSFSLPSSGSSSRRASSRSAAAVSGSDDARSGVRREQMDVDGSGQNEEAVAGTEGDEEEEEEDAETRAQREAFAKKRNAHYGNEAEALKVAQALAAKDDDEEEEDDDGDHAMVVGGPNGRV